MFTPLEPQPWLAFQGVDGCRGGRLMGVGARGVEVQEQVVITRNGDAVLVEQIIQTCDDRLRLFLGLCV
ncbi:hypothetical protein EMIT0P100_20127 [Pseudomonas sp. IT-P100]